MSPLGADKPLYGNQTGEMVVTAWPSAPTIAELTNESEAARLALWDWYQQNLQFIKPLLAPLGSLAVGFGTILVGGLVAQAALQQARIASQRHEAQTKADQQRRIIESFSKAVEQLASDKIEM